MASRRVTIAQLRRLRERLREGQSLASVAQPQLLSAYSSFAPSAKGGSVVTSRITSSGSSFEMRVSAPGTGALRGAATRLRRRASGPAKKQKKSAAPRVRYVPTAILSRRVEAGQVRDEKTGAVKRPTRVSDLAAVTRPTQSREAPLVDSRTLRFMIGALMNSMLSIVR